MIGYRLAVPLASAIPGSEVSKSDRMISFPGGGELWFKSADVGHGSLRGEGLDLAILDEAAFVPGDVWQKQIRPALSDRKGRGLFISTPNGEGDWFHEAYLRAEKGTPGWRAWRLPSWTNPYLDPEEIAEARSNLPSIVFRQEFGAEFVSAAGARVRREWLRVGRPPEGERLTVTMGVDLAISTKDGADYTAAVVMGKAADGRIYILDASRARLPFDGVLRFIRDMAGKHRPEGIAIETVQYQAAVVSELLRTTDLPIRGVRPDRDKVTRFQPLEARMEQGLVYLDPGLPEEFTRELLAFPLGEHDDWIDAMAYAYAGAGRVIAWT